MFPWQQASTKASVKKKEIKKKEEISVEVVRTSVS